jgi:hypothetical protein
MSPTSCISKEAGVEKQLSAIPMKTVCVGRFLMDIPESAIVSFGSARVGGWKISNITDESEEDFTRRLALRKTELATSKNERGDPGLERTIKVANERLIGTLFVFDRAWQHYFSMGKRIDSQSVSYEAFLHSHGRSFELEALLRADEDLEHYSRLSEQFQRAEFIAPPARSGFCFGEGFIVEPLTVEDHEFVMMYIGMEAYPDLAIAISTWANIRLEAPLLERDKKNSVRQTYASRFKDLGTGPRTINGIKGGQLADEVAEFNGTRAFSFQWESAMDKKSVLRPRILLELDTGKGRPGNPVDSSLSRSEVLALWRKISSSIRDRPENLPPAGLGSNQNAKREK